MTCRFLLVLCLVALVPAWAQEAPTEADATTEEDEAALLLAFRDSLDNGPELLENWVLGTDYCAWEGISCSADGKVERITLMELGVVGQIPSPNGWVFPSKTKYLELGINNITGPIPEGWKLPPELNILYFNQNPLGGPIPLGWEIPPALQYLLLENCGLSGSMPEGWPTPGNKLISINLAKNQLTGTIPVSLASIPTAQIIGIQNNQFTGQFPDFFMFNTTYELYGFGASGNNLSGPIPEWPDVPKAMLEIYPGNDGLCGPVPTSPTLITVMGFAETDIVRSLPDCPGSSTNELSAGAIAGISVGAVAGVAFVLVAALVVVKYKRKGSAGSSKAEDKLSADLEKGSSLSPGSSTGPGSGGLSTPTLHNPFMAGPSLGSGSQDTLNTGDVSGGNGGSGSLRMSLKATAALLRGGSGGTGTVGSANSAKLQAKLDQMAKDPPDWLINPSRLVLEQGSNGRLVLLGRGSFGRVYRGWLDLAGGKDGAAQEDSSSGSAAVNKDSSTKSGTGSQATDGNMVRVAVKVMDVGDINAFLREADIMQRLRSIPHVVALHGACVVEEQLVVVMELLEGGDLGAALSADAERALSWSKKGKQIAVDIATGIANLHDKNVTHRDLKSKNVLLAKAMRAKVADVGGAAMHSATYLPAGSSNFGGTLAWAAPELLLGAPCTHKIDIYSLGIVLWEIATHKVPQRGHVTPPPVSEDCPQGLADLIADCLQQDPEKRPTAREVLERLEQL